MKLHNLAARFLTLFGHSALGETLSSLSQKAHGDYDKAVNRAHTNLRDTQTVIGKVAAVEVERLETLVEAAQRRARSLRSAGVVPDTHSQRLSDVFFRTV